MVLEQNSRRGLVIRCCGCHRVEEDTLCANYSNCSPFRSVRSGLVMSNSMLTPLVFLHWFLSVEFLVANVALEWPFIPVCSLMNPQVPLLCVLLPTDLAVEGPLPGVGDKVSLHRSHTNKHEEHPGGEGVLIAYA